MTDPDIRARLAALDVALRAAENRLHGSGRTTADHQATNDELRESYRLLEARVNRDDAAAESQGNHVSALEHSVRVWFAGLDRDGI